MNQIHYSVYNYAIIYLVKNNIGELVHRRTYYKPIILKKNGIWYGFASSNENTDEYELVNNEYLNIRKNLVVGKTVFQEKIQKKWLINAFYPKQFFLPIAKNKVEIKYLKSAEKLLKSN